MAKKKKKKAVGMNIGIYGDGREFIYFNMLFVPDHLAKYMWDVNVDCPFCGRQYTVRWPKILKFAGKCSQCKAKIEFPEGLRVSDKSWEDGKAPEPQEETPMPDPITGDLIGPKDRLCARRNGKGQCTEFEAYD